MKIKQRYTPLFQLVDSARAKRSTNTAIKGCALRKVVKVGTLIRIRDSIDEIILKQNNIAHGSHSDMPWNSMPELASRYKPTVERFCNNNNDKL